MHSRLTVHKPVRRPGAADAITTTDPGRSHAATEGGAAVRRGPKPRRRGACCLRFIAALGLAMGIDGAASQAKPASPAADEKPAEDAGWRSVGAMPAPAWDGTTLLFAGADGALSVTPLSENVIRVRFTTAKDFGRDHSYTILNRDPGKPQAKVEAGPDSTVLETAALRVSIRHNPLRISFADADGQLLDADDPARGISFADGEIRVAKALGDQEHVYGFGEKNGQLDKRGWKLGGYNYVMWNSDTYSYDASTDPMYVGAVLHGGSARPGARDFSRQHLAQFL
jgi:hypothetical protein